MTGLMFYKFLFVFELLVVEALYTFRMKKRKYFVLRSVAAVAVCFFAAYLFPVIEQAYSGWYTSVMFIVLFLITFGAIIFVFKISFKNAVFCAIAAYSAQHLAYELFKLIMMPFDILISKQMYGGIPLDFSQINSSTILIALTYLEVYLAVYASAYFFIGKKLRSESIRIKNTSLLILAGVILLVDVILNAFIVYIDDYNKSYDIAVGVYNTLCCLLVFYIQRSIINVGDIKSELETVSHLLRQAQKQFQIKKDEINLINIKCHDMKHQIGIHARGGGLDGATVAEIEKIISIYDATIKTGNEVLDIILTEKSLICQSKNIKLTCMADCADLDFMSDGELYAMFGNIFDNAIEAVSQVAAIENRCISINIHREGDFVSVMEENYYADELEFGAEGMPVTKKNDKKNHGFGLKSIQSIVEKYGGDISLAARENIFRLNILLPLTARQAKP